MQAPDPIETILARLMPPALSQQGQCQIDTMIDHLAGSEAENVVKTSSGKWLTRSLIGAGIAAAFGALCAVSPMIHRSSEPQVAVKLPQQSPSELVLVSESDRIEAMTDEGWQEGSDGSTMHALRLNVIVENRVQDRETGMVVQISEPREEMLLMPISAF